MDPASNAVLTHPMQWSLTARLSSVGSLSSNNNCRICWEMAPRAPSTTSKHSVALFHRSGFGKVGRRRKALRNSTKRRSSCRRYRSPSIGSDGGVVVRVVEWSIFMMALLKKYLVRYSFVYILFVIMFGFAVYQGKIVPFWSAKGVGLLC